jgi:CMP-N-acetylneuraminic acid synthetase
MKPKITAIVPMRHDSHRVPGKNWRSFAGRPLFTHVVDALLASGVVDRVVIDTDSPAVRSVVKSEYPRLTLLDRPQDLRDDRIAMNEVLLNSVAQLDGELFLQTHSTNPLLTPGTIRRTVETFLASGDRYDSLFTVTELQTRLWDSFARPVNHDVKVLRRTQDLSPVFAENSCMYLFSRQSLEGYRNRIGGRPMMVTLDRNEAWDIDTESDFAIGEMMFHALRQPVRKVA